VVVVEIDVVKKFEVLDCSGDPPDAAAYQRKTGEVALVVDATVAEDGTPEPH
jgi:hypothetical protein